jgi:Putative zinc-finger
MNDNHQNPNCSFAEEIVSYIYGEIGAGEKTAFENHLASCSNCSKEVAEFRNISFSIGAWRDTEFSQMKTPVIEIPYETPQTIIEKESVSASWLPRLRQLFSLSPAWTTASAAMAALVLCVGLVFVVSKFSDDKVLVAVGNVNAAKTAVSPTPESINKPINENPADNSPKPSNNSETDSPNDSIRPELTKEPKNSTQTAIVPVRTADPRKTKIVRQNAETVTSVRQNLPNKDKNNVKPVQTKKAPALNNFEEDEDESLRLADLFAELDTDR